MTRRLSVLVTVFLVTGCATVINGTNQNVWVASEPPGATVVVDNVPEGETPLRLELKRRRTHLVRLERDGYKPYEVLLNRDTSDWVWGNIIVCCGLIGMGVDAMTGAFYNLEPGEIYMQLEKADNPPETPGKN
jgi:hypothetical protein